MWGELDEKGSRNVYTYRLKFCKHTCMHLKFLHAASNSAKAESRGSHDVSGATIAGALVASTLALTLITLLVLFSIWMINKTIRSSKESRLLE